MDDILILFLLEPDKYLLGRILGENQTDVFDPIECTRENYIDEIRKYMIAHPPKRMRMIGEIALCQVIVNEIVLIFDNLEIEIQAFAYAPESVEEKTTFDIIKDKIPDDFKTPDILDSIQTSVNNQEKKTEGGLYTL